VRERCDFGLFISFFLISHAAWCNALLTAAGMLIFEAASGFLETLKKKVVVEKRPRAGARSFSI